MLCSFVIRWSSIVKSLCNAVYWMTSYSNTYYTAATHCNKVFFFFCRFLQYNSTIQVLHTRKCRLICDKFTLADALVGTPIWNPRFSHCGMIVNSASKRHCTNFRIDCLIDGIARCTLYIVTAGCSVFVVRRAHISLQSGCMGAALH